jgi:hypothetical protein
MRRPGVDSPTLAPASLDGRQLSFARTSIDAAAAWSSLGMGHVALHLSGNTAHK